MPKRSKMSQDAAEVFRSAVKGATMGAYSGAAASIVSGMALVSKPVTMNILFWEFVVGTSTVVAAPVVGAFAVGGAAVGLGAAALVRHGKNRRIARELDELLNA